jgi:hypothetical protein
MIPQRLIALVVVTFVLVVTVVRAQESMSRLVDAACSQDEVSLTKIQGVKMIASCESDGSMRAMRISLTNTAPADVGVLRAVSVGFCGSEAVIGAEGPVGWVAEVMRDETRTTVWWTAPDIAVAEHGLRSGQRADGFVVRLRPGWRKSQSESVIWESDGISMVTSHDCV